LNIPSHNRWLLASRKAYASVTHSPYLTYTPSSFTPESRLNYIVQQCSNAVSAEYSSARHKYELQLNVVEHFERQHGIQTRWSPDDPEYVAVQEYAKHRTFIRVVKELEGLVVQRLFELSKANLAGTGSYFTSSPS
jgi:CTP synthase (UTP-ammonia lyase)